MVAAAGVLEAQLGWHLQNGVFTHMPGAFHLAFLSAWCRPRVPFCMAFLFSRAVGVFNIQAS